MPQILRIPKAAVSMREGTLVQWLVADGATVVEGQPIFTLELEKSTMDVESPAAGVIRQTGVAGKTYKVGEIIGEIGAAAAVTPTAPRTPPDRLVQVVQDLDAAIAAWNITTGAGPFFVFPHLALADYTHRGTAGKPDISLAVGAAGDLLIELVLLHDEAPSAWAEAGARSLLLSATTAEFDDAVRAHESAGRNVVSTGRYPFGARFACIDARAASGQWLVLIEKHFVLTQITDKIRAASRAWDGGSLTAELR